MACRASLPDDAPADVRVLPNNAYSVDSACRDVAYPESVYFLWARFGPADRARLWTASGPADAVVGMSLGPSWLQPTTARCSSRCTRGTRASFTVGKVTRAISA